MAAKHNSKSEAHRKDLITVDYQGLAVGFTEDGWFNATKAAERFGKRVDKWLANQETIDYIEALMEVSNTPKKGDLIKTRRGNFGGTWLSPRLAVAFARWLDPKVWGLV
ncbi:MAG: KilA-N domain-containing protein [Anaerolineaceae bacterium]|nr:KilA-N domain-containing protein [Anaerolineaceae bacterium]